MVFPATVFLAPNLIDGNNWFWEEKIKFLLAEIYRINKISSIEDKHETLKILSRYELSDFLSISNKHLN